MKAAVKKTIQLRIQCQIFHNVGLEYFKPFLSDRERKSLALTEVLMMSSLTLWQVEIINEMVDAAHALDVIVALDVIQTNRNLALAHLPPMEFPERSYYGVQSTRCE